MRVNHCQSVHLHAVEKLNPAQLEQFEVATLDAAEPTKRTGYLRSMGKGTSAIFEQYRSIILRDHFERSAQCAIENQKTNVGLQ